MAAPKLTTYCMFGSKKHLMTKLFHTTECPFYKFGDIMFLDKIPETEWIPFICEKFKNTGKHIEEKQALKICQVSENLSSLVQHRHGSPGTRLVRKLLIR